MIHNEHATYYDVLEVSPDASPQEIRNAYLRAKSAYAKDSPALYSLVTDKEAEFQLKRVEEAYHVLSNPDKRREYDRHHGLLTADEDFFDRNRAGMHQKIVSIDRVPPMKQTGTESDILVPPATDFRSEPAKEPAPRPKAAPRTAAAAALAVVPEPVAPAPAPDHPPAFVPERPSVEELVEHEIAAEVEWKGAFIRRIRTARSISIEEMSEITKISKTYITAIEEENYAKLPAAVFLRGFLTQIARTLRVPGDKVTTAFMARYLQARPQK